MVKSFIQPDKKKDYEFPSRFGSHSSMIDEEKTKELNDPAQVVLRDEFGHYVTERNRLDTKMSDPNRYAEKRIDRLFS